MKIHLQEWRKRRLLSVKMLAKKAGVSVGTIMNIEQGKHQPTYETLHKLAEALNIPAEELVTLDEDELRPVNVA